MTENSISEHFTVKAVPWIERGSASLFEEAFLMLITFGIDKFRTHVQTKSLEDQQLIFDTFRLFGLCIAQNFEE